MSDLPPDITPETHPDHWVVGHEFGGHDHQDPVWEGKRWFCYSHDHAGYNMYATDGSGHWTNVSERAIGASFHEIYFHEKRTFPESRHRSDRIRKKLVQRHGGEFCDDRTRPYCSWFRGPVPVYVKKAETISQEQT